MINNVVLVGRLTKDPDLRYTANGKAVASYTLAINRNFTNQAGNREADFVNCVIWGKRAESLANYAKKGTLIGTTGRIQTRNYENQQGERVYVTEVVAEIYQLLESKGVSEAREHAHHGQPQNVGNGQQNQSQAQQSTADNTSQNMPDFPPQDDSLSGSPIDIGDDDLPF